MSQLNGFSTKFLNHLSRFITLRLRISILTLLVSVECWYIMIVIQENIKNYGARKEKNPTILFKMLL